MTTEQITTYYTSAIHYLETGHLKRAFERLGLLITDLQIGVYTDRYEELVQNYRYLLHYFVAGVDDPGRKAVYVDLQSKTFLLAADVREELFFQNNDNFEYTQRRYFPYAKGYTSAQNLLQSLQYYYKQIDFLDANVDASQAAEYNRLRVNYENLLPVVFGLFWLSGNYTADDKVLFAKLFENNYPGWVEKNLAVSAVTLNLWRKFDEQKLMMLLDCCENPQIQVQQRALVGLSFVLAKYDKLLSFFPAVLNRITLLTDKPHVLEYFQNIFIQIIATSETDKISKKLREEILPEVMKVSPLLKDKLDNESLFNRDEWDEANPEWQDILDKSGVTDKLKEITELQMAGADVYLSTFAMLKSFGFFNHLAGWLMPFDAKHSAVNELFKTDDKSVLSAFVNSNVMCNSDKYSFCLSILQMPESQRSLIKQSFNVEADQLEEMAKDELVLNPSGAAKNISKQYIHDLFRVFNLHPQHNEFSSMFEYALSMHRTQLFKIVSMDASLFLNVAEFYFSKNLYFEAIEVFNEVQLEEGDKAAIYQKVGYAYQQLSDFENALEAYAKADLIQPDHLWTVRKMALCYRLFGDIDKALAAYEHADFLKPNSSSVSLNLGHCYMEMQRYKEALKVFFKLDAEDGEQVKVWRAIAWCTFVLGNIHKAYYYSAKLLENEPNASDFMNAGHIAWCQKRVNDAIQLYRKSLEAQANEWKVFEQAFLKDKTYLIANGIDEDELPFMLDSVFSAN